MVRRVVVGVLLSAVTLAGGCIDKRNNTDHARQRGCADRLGVAWNVEDGATERLAAFSACIGGER